MKDYRILKWTSSLFSVDVLCPLYRHIVLKVPRKITENILIDSAEKLDH